MTEKVLTVVVPAYNAEQDLENNLISLCRPAFLRDVQVIVVDDGSTDATGQIADRWAEAYPGTVEVIHKKNGGHGSGINVGIQAAKGVYFKVVDADDWVEEQAFANLLDTLRKARADAVVSGFYWALEEAGKQPAEFRRRAEIEEPFSGVEYGKVYQFDEIADRLYLKMHGLTFRTEILQKQHIYIDENCYYVDTEYILYPIPYIETVLFIPDFVYQYRIGRNGQSVSLVKMQQNAACYDKVLRSLLLFLRKCRSGEQTCSEEKIFYMEGIIARVVAGKIKILLSFPASRLHRQQLEEFDRNIQKTAPSVYRANRNRAVQLLRLSRYTLYRPAAWLLQRKENIRG